MDYFYRQIGLLCLFFRDFPLALDVGCGRGYIAQHLNKVYLFDDLIYFEK